MNWKETGINQNIDSGKTFKGKLYIETIKQKGEKYDYKKNEN